MTQTSDNQQPGVPVGPQPGQPYAVPPMYGQQPPAGITPAPYPYQYPMAPAPVQTTNGTAIFAFIMSLLWLGGLGSILGLCLGIAARKECARNQQPGDGLATAAIVLGGIGAFLLFLMIVF